MELKEVNKVIDKKIAELDTCFKKVTKDGDKHAQDIYFTSIQDLQEIKSTLNRDSKNKK